MRFLPAGPRALLVEVGSTDEALVLYAAARAAGARADDIVPGATTVLFDGVADLGALQVQLASMDAAPVATGRATTVVELPTVYDGADLEEVARQWDVDAAEVVRLHAQTEFTVAFCGFAPGFAYCTGLPEDLRVARRSSPRPRVPAGSVALGGSYSAVYPTSSPGGWQLIGRTDRPLWDASADQPALLTPGVRVRFPEVFR